MVNIMGLRTGWTLEHQTCHRKCILHIGYVLWMCCSLHHLPIKPSMKNCKARQDKTRQTEWQPKSSVPNVLVYEDLGMMLKNQLYLYLQSSFFWELLDFYWKKLANFFQMGSDKLARLKVWKRRKIILVRRGTKSLFNKSTASPYSNLKSTTTKSTKVKPKMYTLVSSKSKQLIVEGRNRRHLGKKASKTGMLHIFLYCAQYHNMQYYCS